MSKVFRALALVVAAVASSLLLAAPAHAADDVDVSLSGLNGSLNAGRSTASLKVTVENNSGNDLVSLHAVFTIILPGLTPDGVAITKQGGGNLTASSADGGVVLSDPATFELTDNQSRTLRYSLTFTGAAPNGDAEVEVDIYRGNDAVVGSDNDGTTVKGGTGAAPTSAAPQNTDPGVSQTFAAAPSVSIASIEVAAAPLSDNDDHLPAVLYAGGSLLLGVGAVVLWLMFRSDPAAAPALAGLAPGAVATTPPPAGGARPLRGQVPMPPPTGPIVGSHPVGAAPTGHPPASPRPAYPPAARPAAPPPAAPPASRRDRGGPGEPFDPWDDGGPTFDPWESAP